MQDVSIRLGKESDFEEIWPFFQEIVKDADSYMFSPDISKEEACKAWFNPKETIFVAVRDNKIVGTYGIRPNWDGLGDHIANASFMVDKKLRGQGIGSLMLKHCLEEAKKMDFVAMQFNAVVSANKAAVSLWKKNGFEVVGQVPKAYHLKQRDYVDIYIMYRKL